jgi:hypothetical protein
MDRVLRIALTVAALALFGASAFVAVEFALMVAPVFFLVLLLFNGVRPGEGLIERYRRRVPAVVSRRRESCRPLAPRVVYRRGRLVVSGLAMRPPPASLAVSS